MRNFTQTFQNLFRSCPPADKPRIVRVLNLWQHNNVFTAETIQPLLDMANPNAQLKEGASPHTSGHAADPAAKSDDSHSAVVLQFLAKSLLNNSGGAASGDNQVRFNKKLLDFDYGEDDDDEEKGETPTEAEPPISRTLATANDEADTNPLALTFAQNLLSNPELLQLMQNNMQQQQQQSSSNFSSQQPASSGASSFIPSFQPVSDNQGRGHASDSSNNYAYGQQHHSYSHRSEHASESHDDSYNRLGNDRDRYDRTGSDNRRDYDDRRRESPRRTSRFSRYPNKRSRSRSPNRRGYSPDARRQAEMRQEPRPLSPGAKEREHERERRKRGIPPIRKGYVTICSTTLWLGHVPKLVSEADISNAFGEFGTIVSIDVSRPHEIVISLDKNACRSLFLRADVRTWRWIADKTRTTR